MKKNMCVYEHRCKGTEKTCKYFRKNPPYDYPHPDCWYECNGFCNNEDAWAEYDKTMEEKMNCSFCKKAIGSECYPAEKKYFCSVSCKIQYIRNLRDEISGEIEDNGRLDTIDGMKAEIQRLEDTYDI